MSQNLAHNDNSENIFRGGDDTETADQVQRTLERLGHRVRAIPAAVNEKREELLHMFPNGTRQPTFAPGGNDGSWEPERWADRRIRQQKKIEDMDSEAQDARAELYRMISPLDSADRSIVLAIYVNNLKPAQIASAMQCNAKTIYRKHDRAIQKMMIGDQKHGKG